MLKQPAASPTILITAAEEEEKAFRHLRDRWQPGDTALFERIDEQRAQASRAQRDAEDRVIALRQVIDEVPDPETRETFPRSLELILNDWKSVHDEYAKLRTVAESRETVDGASGFARLAEELTSVIDALGELPHLVGAEGVVKELLSAAEAEQRALLSLGKRFESVGNLSVSDGADPGIITPGPELPDFAAVDDSIEESETVLEQAGRIVQSIDDADVSADPADLQTFSDEHSRLRLAWDIFHDRYDEWRGDEGGCDRVEVVRMLEQFALRVARVSREVRDLPISADLLPMHGLLVEAITLEEDTVRALRYTWRPFAIDAFRAVHKERIKADGLRREADTVVQELIGRALQ